MQHSLTQLLWTQTYHTGGLKMPFSGHFCQCSHLRRPTKHSKFFGFHLLWPFAFPSLSVFISLQGKFPCWLLALKAHLIRVLGIPHCWHTELLHAGSVLMPVSELKQFILCSAWHSWSHWIAVKIWGQGTLFYIWPNGNSCCLRF